MFYNGRKLTLESLENYIRDMSLKILRYINVLALGDLYRVGVAVAVDRAAFSPANYLELIYRALYRGCIGAVRKGFEVGIAHISYHIRVSDNDLISLLFAQIGKVRKHLLCRFKIKGRLLIAVIIAHRVLDNGSECCIRLFHKMDIASGADRLSECLGYTDNSAVKLLELLF